MKPSKNIFLKAGLSLGVIFITTWLVAGPYPQPDTGPSWHIIWKGDLASAMEEANPGTGASGILAIYFMNTSDAGGRATNDSYTIQGWCNTSGLGYTNANAQQTDLKSSTNFEIWVRVRGNATVCKHGSTWWDSDLRVQITSSDLSIGALTSCTNYATSNNTAYTYLYVNCVLAGPYSLSKGQTAQITAIVFSAYY